LFVAKGGALIIGTAAAPVTALARVLWLKDIRDYDRGFIEYSLMDSKQRTTFDQTFFFSFR